MPLRVAEPYAQQMRATSAPWQLLSVVLAGMLNEHQQRVIEYLRAENQILREQIGTERVLLTDGERRRLAVLGKAAGRKALCSLRVVDARDDPASTRGEARSAPGQMSSSPSSLGFVRDPERAHGSAHRGF